MEDKKTKKELLEELGVAINNDVVYCVIKPGDNVQEFTEKVIGLISGEFEPAQQASTSVIGDKLLFELKVKKVFH